MSFDYKNKIENSLIDISFLYSGDIISSSHLKYEVLTEFDFELNNIIKNTIINIYNQSFQKMVNKAKEFTISNENTKIESDLLNEIFKLGIKPVFIFCSNKGKNLFGRTFTGKISNTTLPDYFYSFEKITSVDIEIFYSPLIKEKNDEIILYISDSPIQSLVYTIQNMEYQINRESNGKKYLHTIYYDLYDCRFNSYKISIKDIAKLRYNKINKILNDN